MIAKAPADATKFPKKRHRRAWQPAARDHEIYRLVKFECLTQSEVAERQRLSQSTISRIIDRYERWQAHADPREGGRLDPAERLRAQRWLTYERNELILTSALRLARETQGLQTVWSIASTRAASPYRAHHDQQREETRAIDRTGLAARYLRLAFKVNMEQLALVEKDPPPLPEPLTAAEIAEEERLDAAAEAEDRAEAAEHERREREANEALERWRAAELAEPAAAQAAETDSRSRLPDATLARDPASRCESAPGGEPRGESAPTNDAGPARQAGPTVINLHKMHNAHGEQSSATAAPPCTCAADRELQKNAESECIDVGEAATPEGQTLACEPC